MRIRQSPNRKEARMLPISVVVSLTEPDVGSCLGRLLRELRQQTVPPFEIIITGHDSYQREVFRTILESGSMVVPILDDDCNPAHALTLGVAAANCGVVACLRHDASPLPATWLQSVAELFQGNSIDLAFPAAVLDRELSSDPCQAITRRSLPATGRWGDDESLLDWAERVATSGYTVAFNNRVASRPLVLA